MDEQDNDGPKRGSSKVCEFVDRCPMFPQFQSKRILRMFQMAYCESDFESCARHKLAQQSKMPPPDLLPDGTRLGPSNEPHS